MASNRLNGTVSRIFERKFTSKAGKSITKHGIEVNGVEAELDGFKQKYSVGDTVDLSVEFEYKRWNVKGPGNPSDAPVPGGRTSVSGTTGDAPVAGGGSTGSGMAITKDQSIARQNALGHASRIVASAFDNQAQPSSFENAPPGWPDELAKRADLAIQIAYKMASFTTGHLDEMAAKQLADALNKAAA